MGHRLDNAKALYIEGIRDGHAVTAIAKYSGSRYTQQSTAVKEGRDGFIEFFEDFFARNPIRDIEIVRGFEDGRCVCLHAAQTLNDGEYRYVTADIFDTDDVLKNGDVDKLADYLSTDTFIQHNPAIGDGVEGFRGYLTGLTALGEAMVYTEVHKVIGCGSFVAACRR